MVPAVKITVMSIGLDIKLFWVNRSHVKDIRALDGDEATPIGATPPLLHPGERALAYVEHVQRLRARGLQATFAIRAADQFVGLIALAREPEAPARAELGYRIGLPYRGRGYATAAVARILEHGFRRMRLAVVVARCQAENPASARVLEKLAFRFIGPEVTHDRAGSGVRRYELTGPEWRRRPAPG